MGKQIYEKFCRMTMKDTMCLDWDSLPHCAQEAWNAIWDDAYCAGFASGELSEKRFPRDN
jgi:hypothetical protein